MGVLENIRTVGGGTLNFPLLISFQTVVLLLLLIVAGCAVIASFREGTSQHPLLYLICLSLISLPAAFSRADVGHIIINTLGALIAALTILSQYPAIWRWTRLCFALVVFLAWCSHWSIYRGIVEGAVQERAFSDQYHSAEIEKLHTKYLKIVYGKSETQRRIDGLRSYLATDPGAPHLPFHTYMYAPLGVRRMMSPFIGDPQIVTGRYPWIFPMTSMGILQNEIAELETHPDWPLVLPSKTATFCEENPDATRHYLKKVLYVPYVPRIRHQIKAGDPFCEYIDAHYVLSTYVSPVTLRSPSGAVNPVIDQV